jgi:hypothetical protein
LQQPCEIKCLKGDGSNACLLWWLHKPKQALVSNPGHDENRHYEYFSHDASGFGIGGEEFAANVGLIALFAISFGTVSKIQSEKFDLPGACGPVRFIIEAVFPGGLFYIKIPPKA